MKRLIFLILLLGGCSWLGTSDFSNPRSQAAAIKGQGGTYKIGNPYKIMGQYYVPQEDYNYSEIGMASWYGKDFHAKKTANGEDYDMDTLTAAHRTLPMPSIVRVTNLENGRSLVLRVNDRGPFVKNRIIDVSKRASQLLGFHEQGTTKVKVEIMADESRKLRAAMLGLPEVESAPVRQVIRQDTIEEGYLIGATANDVSNKGSGTKTGSSGEIYVQAGSFSQSNLAQDLGVKLSSVGDVNVSQAFVNGASFYRVRMGPFVSEEDAAKVLDKVRNFGIQNARIINE